jgi:hypothetical protein
MSTASALVPPTVVPATVTASCGVTWSSRSQLPVRGAVTLEAVTAADAPAGQARPVQTTATAGISFALIRRAPG